MIKTGGFHHVAMRVMDFENVVEFYTQGLGYTKGIYWGDGDSRAQMIDLGNDNFIEIFSGGNEISDAVNNGLLHIALRSDDCARDLENAVNAGAIVTMPVTDINLQTHPVNKIRIAFFKVLQGEIIEFFQDI